LTFQGHPLPILGCTFGSSHPTDIFFLPPLEFSPHVTRPSCPRFLRGPFFALYFVGRNWPRSSWRPNGPQQSSALEERTTAGRTLCFPKDRKPTHLNRSLPHIDIFFFWPTPFPFVFLHSHQTLLYHSRDGPVSPLWVRVRPPSPFSLAEGELLFFFFVVFTTFWSFPCGHVRYSFLIVSTPMWR